MNIKREKKRKKEPTFKLKELYTGWDIRRAADICKLTALQRTVIERIADCAQREHCLTSVEQAIYPGYEDLARRIGSVRGGENISSRSLSRAVSRLSALGYLIVIASPRGNRFFIAKSIFLRAYLLTHPADKAIRNQLADELRKVREANRKNPKRFGGKKGRELKKVHSHMTDLAKAVKEGREDEKSKLAELGNVVNIFCKTRSKKMREINFLYRSDLPTTTGPTCQQRQVRPASRGSSIEPTLSGTTESRTHVYIPTSKSIDSVENTAGVKVGMDVFVKHDVFGRYARVFRQQPASKAEIESFYAGYLNLPEANFSAILRRLEIFETVPPMQTSSCARGYSHLKRLLSDVESVAAAKRTGLGVDYKFWDKVPSRAVVAKIALDKGWSPELTHQWLLEKPADESFLNLVKSIAADRAEAKRVIEDERAWKQAEHEAMEARLSGESEEYRQLAVRLQEQNSYRVFPGCDWVKDFITKATLAQLSAAVEDGGRFEDKKEISGDQAEQAGDASGTGPAEAPAETGEENQPAPEAINPSSADFGWEPEYDDDCPTAGELNAVFCDQPEGGIPEEQTEAPEASGDTQTPPVTPTTTEKAPMGSEAEAPDSVEPPSTIAHEEKEMAEVSGQGKSSADDFQERAQALLDRAENLTGPAKQKIWDQAMALRKERDEAKKHGGKVSPPPEVFSSNGPVTGDETGEQSATQAKKVQQFSVNDPRGFEMSEFLNGPLPEESVIASGLGRKKPTEFSDAALDDFIFGDSGESALESGIWLDKKGVPSPEKPASTHGTEDGTVADDIRDEQEVQPHAVDSSHSAEIPEDLNSSPSVNQDGELTSQRDIQPEQSSAGFDAQLDEFILAGLGETEPEAGGLMGSGSEWAGSQPYSGSFAVDSTTGCAVVEKQRPDTSAGSGHKIRHVIKDNDPIGVETGSCWEDFAERFADRQPENQRPEAQIESGPCSAMKSQSTCNSIIPENLAGPADLSRSVEEAIRIALGAAGPPADQKKSVAGQKNIPPGQNADPAQERSVSAGKKKISGNVAVRDSGKRELTPPSTESTDGGDHSAVTPEQITTRRNSEEVGLLPGETVDEYVKRACRVYFLNKPLQHLQTSERILKLPNETEKLREARQLLMGIQKPKTAA